MNQEAIWWARTDVRHEEGHSRDQFVALPESLAEVALSWRVVLEVRTWGDLRARVDPPIVSELQDFATEADATVLPLTDDSPFDISVFSPFHDGDWPPPPQVTMLDSLPAEIVDNFGTVERTTLNGDQVRFPGHLAEAICGELRATGYVVVAKPELAEVLQEPSRSPRSPD